MFYTAKNLRFKYTIKGGELFVDRKQDSITCSTVLLAYRKVLELHGGRGNWPEKAGDIWSELSASGVSEDRDYKCGWRGVGDGESVKFSGYFLMMGYE